MTIPNIAHVTICPPMTGKILITIGGTTCKPIIKGRLNKSDIPESSIPLDFKSGSTTL